MSDSDAQQPQQQEQAEAVGEPQQADGEDVVATSEPQEAGGDDSPQEQQALQEGDGEEEKAGEGAEEGEKDGEQKEEEEKITITHEESPHWLSREECLAKGIAEEQVTSFQHTYFQYVHTIRSWYEKLSEHTFTTELIQLSKAEVDVILAASHPGQAAQPELSDEQKEVLEQIEKKLNDAIEKFEGDGGFIRVNDRNPTDSILERNDAEFVAKVRDAVINELEVFKQSADAYLIWRDQEKTEGAFRRGMSRIRQSFRRQRAPSASGRRKEETTPKLEDTTGQEEEKKAEEATPTDQAEQAKEGGGEGEGQTVTVEAEVEADGEKGEGEGGSDEQEQAKPAEPESPGQQEADGEGTKTEEEKKDDDDIQKVPDQEAEKEAPKPKRIEHPPIRKIKSESLDNEILRAFGRAVTNMYRATTGKDALNMILRSGLTKQYLEQLKRYGEIEGLSATISVTRFHADIARYPGMVLRGFVYKGELTALSQKHDDATYFPNMAQYKNIIQYKVEELYRESVKETLAERDSYIIDVFVSTEKVYVLRLSPFYTGTGACLFTWTEDTKLLTRPPINFKIVESPRKAPDLYSGLQSQWNSMLDSVLQQKQNENRSQPRTCTLL